MEVLFFQMEILFFRRQFGTFIALKKFFKIFRKVTMKKIYLTFMVLVSCVFASDELNIDSLLKSK